MAIRDSFKRALEDLRISVTDRCNLRCLYCMPLAEYDWVERRELLTFEEIERLARLFISLGAQKICLTGGEPLLRREIEVLARKLARLPGLGDLSLTTNGVLLADHATTLREAGVKRINVSLDTLKPERFRQIAQRGELEKVLAGIEAARLAGFKPIKINSVIERGVNDDEIPDLVEFARANGYTVRFIEYMDVGNANHWKLDRVVTKSEIVKRISARYAVEPAGREDASAPADNFRFLDGKGEFGVVASVTEPFCRACTRARLTADGNLVTCLFSDCGHDLKGLMRAGASDETITGRIREIWKKRADRFSEERFEAMKSPEGYQPEGRRKIEMIVLGG